MKLQVNQLFESFDGEVNLFHQGRRATFLRLAGCNLSCSYCDAPQARDLSNARETETGLLAKLITNMAPSKLTITGGEPFIQPEGVIELIKEIQKIREMNISIETNGTVPVPVDITDDICLIMDYKLTTKAIPLEEAFGSLYRTDFVKFVISNKLDFERAIIRIEWIKACMNKAHNISSPPQFAFSPIHGEVSPKQLAKWIMESPVENAIINLQLHKYIWPDAKHDC